MVFVVYDQSKSDKSLLVQVAFFAVLAVDGLPLEDFNGLEGSTLFACEGSTLFASCPRWFAVAPPLMRWAMMARV